MNTRPNHQQGDVLLRPLASMPDGEQKLVSKGKCVLAHGESGHTHLIDAAEGDVELIQIGEQMLLNVKNPVKVQHEEHDVQMLEPGIWEIGRVQETDHFANVTRSVVD